VVEERVLGLRALAFFGRRHDGEKGLAARAPENVFAGLLHGFTTLMQGQSATRHKP
jgi:hypothetical protein